MPFRWDGISETAVSEMKRLLLNWLKVFLCMDQIETGIKLRTAKKNNDDFV